jgi:hypothetical protein
MAEELHSLAGVGIVVQEEHRILGEPESHTALVVAHHTEAVELEEHRIGVAELEGHHIEVVGLEEHRIDLAGERQPAHHTRHIAVAVVVVVVVVHHTAELGVGHTNQAAGRHNFAAGDTRLVAEDIVLEEVGHMAVEEEGMVAGHMKVEGNLCQIISACNFQLLIVNIRP